MCELQLDHFLQTGNLMKLSEQAPKDISSGTDALANVNRMRDAFAA
jgi:hypothetical protein